jgi:hypothetical protein
MCGTWKLGTQIEAVKYTGQKQDDVTDGEGVKEGIYII